MINFFMSIGPLLLIDTRPHLVFLLHLSRASRCRSRSLQKRSILFELHILLIHLYNVFILFINRKKVLLSFICREILDHKVKCLIGSKYTFLKAEWQMQRSHLNRDFQSKILFHDWDLNLQPSDLCLLAQALLFLQDLHLTSRLIYPKW